MTVFLVAPENLEPLWPQVEPLLTPALEREGTHDADDVYGVLRDGRAHLWIEWRNALIACVVTEFVYFPKLTRLRVWVGGAVGKGTHWENFAAVIRKWAAAQGCHSLQIEGRKGWLRVFPGLVKSGFVMRENL